MKRETQLRNIKNNAAESTESTSDMRNNDMRRKIQLRDIKIMQ